MTTTVESIIRQWSGGEHRLAAERASEMVYDASAVLNDELLSQIRDGAPGIDAYLVAPVVAPVAVLEAADEVSEELPVEPVVIPAVDEAPPVVQEESPANEMPAEPAPAA